MVQGAVAGNYKAYDATALDLVFAGTRNVTAANRLWALDMVNLGAGSGTSFSFDNGGTGTPANAFGIISSQPSVDYAAKRIYFTTRKKAGGSQQTVWCVGFSATAFTACPGFAPSTAIGDVDGSVIPWKGNLYVGTTTARSGSSTRIPGRRRRASRPGRADKGLPLPSLCGESHEALLLDELEGLGLHLGRNDSRLGVEERDGWRRHRVPSIPTFDGTSVFVGSSDGKLHQLTNLATDPPTHTSLVLGAGTVAVGSPTLDYAVPNLLYVGTDAGLVYAVQHPVP